MYIRFFRSCLSVILLALLFSACARKAPQPEQSVSVMGQGRSGPIVTFESQEIFLAHLHPANLNMTSWKQLEPVLSNSLRYVDNKNSSDSATDVPGLALTWGDIRRTLTTLLGLLPSLDENPAQFAEHFEWRAVPDGISYSGYYEPMIRASWFQKPGYEHPIYATPPDMRRQKQRHGFYYDRKAIDGRKVLAGQGLELAWAADPVDVFYMQIQGSGRLIFEDGSSVSVNYDSQNGHKYVSIGRIMRERGLLKQGHIFEQRAWFKANPQAIDDVLFENPSYVFFKLGGQATGAIGAMGCMLEPWASLATDRQIIPLGAVVAYAVNIPDREQGEVPLRAIGLAQDVGGAIKNNRIDIFCGLGGDGEYVASHLDRRGPAWMLVAKKDEPASQVSIISAQPDSDVSQVEAQVPMAETETDMVRKDNEPAQLLDEHAWEGAAVAEDLPLAIQTPESSSQASTDSPVADSDAVKIEVLTAITEAETAMMREDYATARNLLEKPAREGDAEAADLLGHMLLFGRGGPMDVVRAEELLRNAAEKNRPEAQNSMGVLYMTGINGVIDPIQAIAWFRKAAEQGHAYAMFNMGRAAEQGLSMKKSKTEALAWYAKAAHKGSEAAKIRLEELQDTKAPPNKKRNMSYQLDARTQVAQRASQSTTNDPVPTFGQIGEAKSTGLEICDVLLNWNNQIAVLSFNLVNTKHSVQQGKLRLTLLRPDNSKTPLANTTFNVKKFIDKKLNLTLPAETPNDSRILIEALTRENVLIASYHLTLPKS